MPALDVTNVEKLSGNWSIGQILRVGDGFVLNSPDNPNGTQTFWYPNGTSGGRTAFAQAGDTASSLIWSAGDNSWEGSVQNGGYSFQSQDGDVVNPWDVTLWSGDITITSLTHPAVQELAAPSTDQGGVAVLGGTQDGVYKDFGDLFDDKKKFGLLGVNSGEGDNTSCVHWFGGVATANYIDDTGAGPHSAGFAVLDGAGVALYYSLSDVATPDLAGTDKAVMYDGNLPVFTKRGTSGGKPYYNRLGESDSTSLNALVWVAISSFWLITNGAGVPTNTSTSDTPTPDLAVWDSDSVINVPWLNASDDSPASITVTSVSVGELNAGVTVAGGDTGEAGVYAASAGTSSTVVGYAKVDGPQSIQGFSGPEWDFSVNSFVVQDVPFAYLADWSGNSPAPTVTRNDVAAEANWLVTVEPPPTPPEPPPTPDIVLEEYHTGIGAPMMTGPIPVIKVTNYPAHMIAERQRQFVEKQVREDFELVQVLTKWLENNG